MIIVRLFNSTEMRLIGFHLAFNRFKENLDRIGVEHRRTLHFSQLIIKISLVVALLTVAQIDYSKCKIQ